MLHDDSPNGVSEVSGFIVAVLEHEDGTSEVFETHNIITDAGDTFYAQKICGQTPTNAFANLILGSGAVSPTKASTYASITPIASTNKAPTATYPKTSDADADNTGAGADIVTWAYSYAKADFNHAAITEGVISLAGATGSNPVLCHFRFASAINKTANDTLKVFVNHTQNGV